MEGEINKNLYENPNEILYISFNQDNNCIAIGTEKGFKIINTFPFIDLYYKEMNGGIGIIEMYEKSNILALVGGGKNPVFPENELILWDEEKNSKICKIKSKLKILNVKIQLNKIFIVNEEKILVFDFNTLNLLECLETKNSKGLLTICKLANIIAYPDSQQQGAIRIKYYNDQKELYLKVHKTPLNFIQLNQQGNLIATCSLKGTIIRIYDIERKQLISEVRRGTDKASVNYIAFDVSQKYLLAISDKKAVNLFFIKVNNNLLNQLNNNSEITRESDVIDEKTNNIVEVPIGENENKPGIFGGVSHFFRAGKKFFNSEWYFSKFKINTQKAIGVFAPDNSIIIITYDGKYYQVVYDPVNGEECIKIQEEKF